MLTTTDRTQSLTTARRIDPRGTTPASLPTRLIVAYAWASVRGELGRLDPGYGEDALAAACREIERDARREGIDGVYEDDLRAIAAWGAERVAKR